MIKAYLLLAVTVLVGIAGLLYLSDLEAKRRPPLETQMNDCRHVCVAVQAESFMYGPGIGCVCGASLP